MTLLAPHTNELRKISELPTEPALRHAATFLGRLVKDPDFVGSQILPLLEEAKDSEDWYVARRHEGKDGSYSLQVFVWPAGTGTKIHDHSSWGAYCCAVGTVVPHAPSHVHTATTARTANIRRRARLAGSMRPLRR